MTEVGVTVVLALFTALGAATRQLHSKIDNLDSRVDRHELRVAEQYISKQDFLAAINRMEDHMIRIENKLDKLSS